MHADAGDTGRPHWGVELKIVPVDGSAAICRLDAEGEILVRAPSLMTAYLPVGLLLPGQAMRKILFSNIIVYPRTAGGLQGAQRTSCGYLRDAGWNVRP